MGRKILFLGKNSSFLGNTFLLFGKKKFLFFWNKKCECNFVTYEIFRNRTKYNNRIKYYYIHFLTQEEIFIEQEGQYIDKEKLKEIQTRFYSLYMNNKKFIRFVEEVEQIK